MKDKHRKFLKDVRTFGGELQHKLLKVVLDERWIRKVQQSHAIKVSRLKVWKLLNDEVKAKFSEKMEVSYQKSDEKKCMAEIQNFCSKSC